MSPELIHSASSLFFEQPIARLAFTTLIRALKSSVMHYKLLAGR